MNKLTVMGVGFTLGYLVGLGTVFAATADHQCEPVAIETEAAQPTETRHIVLQTEPVVEESIEETEAVEELESLGEFRVTAYCNCEICCGKWSKYNKTKSGTTPKEGRTIAVYEDQIPLGTEVIINDRVYIAEDTGSAIKRDCIDIYFDSHDVAREFGVQYREVFVRR